VFRPCRFSIRRGINLEDVHGYETFTKTELINRGTNDKKYYIETLNGQRLLLRIADVSKYKSKENQFNMLNLLSELNIHMSRPIALGMCGDDKNVYQLLTWVDGVDLESMLPTMSETEQYNYGLKAGMVLGQIHSVPAPENTKNWELYFYRTLQKELDEYYSKTEIHCELGEIIVKFIEGNRSVINFRPQVYLHGDYNPGNLIIMPSGEVGVIDFSSRYGDFIWDIFKVHWRPHLYPHFFSGQINGCVNEPDLAFWEIYTFYFAYGALIALTSPQWVGLNNFEEGKLAAQNILNWSNNFNNSIPSWYLSK